MQTIPPIDPNPANRHRYQQQLCEHALRPVARDSPTTDNQDSADQHQAHPAWQNWDDTTVVGQLTLPTKAS